MMKESAPQWREIRLDRKPSFLNFLIFFCFYSAVPPPRMTREDSTATFRVVEMIKCHSDNSTVI